MGYTTNFTGSFTITPALSPFLRTFLKKLATTRRMRRRAPEALYGVEGEFFVEGHGFMGQGDDTPESCPILDHNTPPSTQPGLWLQSTTPHQDAELAAVLTRNSPEGGALRS